jgi:hypothetical protein
MPRYLFIYLFFHGLYSIIFLFIYFFFLFFLILLFTRAYIGSFLPRYLLMWLWNRDLRNLQNAPDHEFLKFDAAIQKKWQGSIFINIERDP